jgi:hypothetical protein
VLNQVTTGAASYANPQTAFHRQDGGANALTGIRASRSQFIKRTATPEAADTGSVKWQPSANAGINAAKRPAPVQAVIDAAAQTTAAAQTAQPAAIVEISDEGRELAAQMSEAKPVLEAVFKFVPDGDNSFEIVKNDDPLSSKAKNFFENEVATAIAKGKTSAPKLTLQDTMYSDNALSFAIGDALKFKYDVDNITSFKLSAELGRLLQGPANTIEERVVNREKGLELAKYIAENYIDGPDAKQQFLDRAKELAKYAELQDKGYFVAMTMDGGRSVTKIDDNLLIKEGKPTEKQATDIINKTKNSLDINAIKEDVLNTFKKIMANFAGNIDVKA